MIRPTKTYGCEQTKQTNGCKQIGRRNTRKMGTKDTEIDFSREEMVDGQEEQFKNWKGSMKGPA